MTEQSGDDMPSIEGLKTVPFCKIVEAAGHQVLFWYELGPQKMMKHAEVNVPGLGHLDYKIEVPAMSRAEADVWLNGVNKEMARKALGYFAKIARACAAADR
jgi:hypothetical protein